MKIYSDGKSRTLKGKFPRRFKLLQDGIDVPFLRTGAGSIRIVGEVPVGALDIEEVITNKAPMKANLQTSSNFSIINSADFDKIDLLNKKIAISQQRLNENLANMKAKEDEIKAIESQNAKAIEDTNATIVEMAKAVGKEIQADRESIKQASASLLSSLRETGDILSSKIEAHEKAKNPHNISKATIGLERVDNTSDEDKPISKKTQKALDKKADKSEVIELAKKIDATGKQQDKIAKGLDRLSWIGGVGGNGSSGGGSSASYFSEIAGSPYDNAQLASALNGKQDKLTEGDGIDISANKISNSGVRSISTGLTNGTISVNTNGESEDVAVKGLGSAAYTESTAYDASGAASTAETNAKNYADGLASNYATAAQGAKADTAVQPADISNMQTTTNLVTSVSAQSTDTQYPSAKLFYDTIGTLESVLNNINSGS